MEEAVASKSARLQQVVHLLYRNPAGLTTQALARHCGVTMRTVQRDLKDLEEVGIPLWEEAGRYGVVAGYYLPPVHFSLEEDEACDLGLVGGWEVGASGAFTTCCRACPWDWEGVGGGLW
jgi:predicted DNA-binding transcriptional regulator YafY